MAELELFTGWLLKNKSKSQELSKCTKIHEMMKSTKFFKSYQNLKLAHFLRPQCLANEIYGKCSKILNTCRSVFIKNVGYQGCEGAQWLSGRVLDSRPKGRGFEPASLRCGP